LLSKAITFTLDMPMTDEARQSLLQESLEAQNQIRTKKLYSEFNRLQQATREFSKF
jgi:(p)ppGpp synthase/HD superfamily hydrolase